MSDVETEEQLRSAGAAIDRPEATSPGCGKDVHSPLPGKDPVEQHESLPDVGDVLHYSQTESKGVPDNPVRLLPSRVTEKPLQPKYSRAIGEFISKLVSQGILLSQLCEMPGMPSLFTIRGWLRDHEEFNANMKLAEQAAAQFYADRAIMVANASQWQTAKSDTIKVETAKWAAERLNPDKYSAKKVNDTVNNNSVTYNIFTGWEDGMEKVKSVVIDKRDPREIIEEENRKKTIVEAEVVSEEKDEPSKS